MKPETPPSGLQFYAPGTYTVSFRFGIEAQQFNATGSTGVVCNKPTATTTNRRVWFETATADVQPMG
jgi:hypothetical protein